MSEADKLIEVEYYSECKAVYIIDDLKQSGFSGEYQEINEEDSVVIYPNYKEADDIVCGYVGCDTMEDSTENWEYLKDRKS
tara:strand:+ start:497 stop:739 length:243 start_codon:yes stop_codon:yes gene_type:complete